VDFQQADAQFRWLEDQLRMGALTEQQYQAGLVQLQVTDAFGRRWMKQQHTGQWHVLVNNQWMPSQPPPVPAPAAPAYPSAPPAYPQAPAQAPAYPQPPVVGGPSLGQVYPQPAAAVPAYPQPVVAVPAQVQPPAGVPDIYGKKEPSLFGKYVRMFLLMIVIWGIIGVVVVIATGQIEVIYGVALAALLSFIITIKQMGGSWKGQIIEIRTVEEDDGDDGTEDVTYTFIRETSGKIRKEKGAMAGWQVGDWLEKRQGENWYRKVN